MGNRIDGGPAQVERTVVDPWRPPHRQLTKPPLGTGAALTGDLCVGRKRVCLVGAAFLGAGEGTPHLRGIVADAVAAGFDVTLVDPGSERADAVPKALGVPPGVDLQQGAPAAPAIEPGYMRSTAALFRHLRARHFDAILFQDQGGLGFASIIAKQAALAFTETVLGVVACGPSRWRRECDGRFPADLVTIGTEYLEQRAAELADLVILPSQPVAEWMQRAGWRLGGTLRLPDPAGGTRTGLNLWADVVRHALPEQRRSTTAWAEGGRPHDVTVVITSYEQPRLLDQSLEALTHQTDLNFSVLVVDDGSQSGEALQYLSGVEAQYRALNLRLIQQPHRFLGAARNTGIRAANTDFVILLDDDNVPFPDMVGTLRRAIRHAEADVVTCGMRCFHDPTGPPPIDTNSGGPDQLFSAGPLLLGAVHNCLGDASGIYRTSVFEKVGYFHELQGRVFEDWQLLLKVVAAGLRLLSVPEPLVWYRVRPDSLLRTTRRYDNARVIAATIDGMSCSTLEGLADFLMGSEAEQVRLNAEIARLTAESQETLDARTKSAEDAARYARSLEQVVAELRASNAAATEYAASLEQARADAETYAKHLEMEYRRLEMAYRKLLDAG